MEYCSGAQLCQAPVARNHSHFPGPLWTTGIGACGVTALGRRAIKYGQTGAAFWGAGSAYPGRRRATSNAAEG